MGDPDCAARGPWGPRRTAALRALAAAAGAILAPGSTSALADVIAERTRQDAKSGEQNHDPFAYLAILMEEVGELAQAAIQARFEGGDPKRIREEAMRRLAAWAEGVPTADLLAAVDELMRAERERGEP